MSTRTTITSDTSEPESSFRLIGNNRVLVDYWSPTLHVAPALLDSELYDYRYANPVKVRLVGYLTITVTNGEAVYKFDGVDGRVDSLRFRLVRGRVTGEKGGDHGH